MILVKHRQSGQDDALSWLGRHGRDAALRRLSQAHPRELPAVVPRAADLRVLLDSGPSAT